MKFGKIKFGFEPNSKKHKQWSLKTKSGFRIEPNPTQSNQFDFVTPYRTYSNILIIILVFFKCSKYAWIEPNLRSNLFIEPWFTYLVINYDLKALRVKILSENCRWNETTSGYSRPYMHSLMLEVHKKIFSVRFDRTEFISKKNKK